MASECEILGEIYNYYGMEPYWSSSNSCLKGKDKVVVTDSTNSYITEL